MCGSEAQQFCLLFNAEAEAAGWPMRCDAACRFGERKLNELYTLWQEKARNGVPSRAMLDMRTLKSFMRHVTILEKVETPAGHSYRFRLFGSALAMAFGEHTGHLLEEMVLPSSLPGWLAFYDMVLATGRPLQLINTFRVEMISFLRGELFAAPLTDDAGVVRYILAATFVDPVEAAHSPFTQAGPLAV